MPRFVELHISASNSPIAVNPDEVIRIGCMSVPDRTFLRFTDGGSVDVAEDYATVAALLGGLTKAARQA